MEHGKPTIPEKGIQTGEQPTAPEEKVEMIEKSRYEEASATITKKSQALIEATRRLVDKDPTEVERISDEKLQKKILLEKWDVESVEELKIIHPEALSWKNTKKEDMDDEVSEVEKMRRDLEMMKLKDKKTKTKDAIDSVVRDNKDLVETIPQFVEKLKEEMKYISSDIPAKQRAEKAFKAVAFEYWNPEKIYSIVQGETVKKGKKSSSWWGEDTSNLAKAFQNAFNR